MTSIAALSNRQDPLPGSVTQLASAYRRALEAQGKSPRTIETYLEALARLDAFLVRSTMPRLMALLQRDHLEAFIADVQSNQSPATAVARYRALQSFFRWCEEDGEIDRNPMTGMRPPAASRAPTAVSRAPSAVIPQVAVVQLLRACEGREFRDVRDMAIVRLFIDTGLRRNELAMLRVDDVNLRARTAAVPGRGGTVRIVQITPTTARAIDRYVRIGRAGHPTADSPALWLGHGGPMTGNGIYQAIEVRTVKAGLERIHPNQFRQTFAHEQLRRDTQEPAGDELHAVESAAIRDPVATSPLDAARASMAGPASVSWPALEPAVASSSVVEPPVAVEPLSGAPLRPRIDLSADLVHAMQLAAEQARAGTFDQVRAEAASIIERIEARSSFATSEMRRRADDDVAGVEDWATAEIARIRAEAETRATTRPGRLVGQVQGHASVVEHEIESVRGRTAAFDASAGSSDGLAATAATGAADAGEPMGATDLDEARAVAGHAPAVHSPRRVTVGADRARGTARITTLTVPRGSVSLANIARFKRQLSALAGIRWVSVSSNRDGTIQFEIAHDWATDFATWS
jgi:site-specific recombinase XerC